ncbi:hypothetical protein FK515_28330 [Klebsiella pneumoniae]|nr:hypothetical protein [Klebsiella pneumoniae]
MDIAKNCVLEGVSLGPSDGDGGIMVCPVTQGQQGRQWSPLDYKLFREWQKAVKEEGVNGVATRAILDVIWAANPLPFDCRQLARAVFTAPQMVLWEATSKEEADKVVLEALDPNHPLHGITVERIMGSGNFTDPAAQANMRGRDINAAVRAAQVAFAKMGKYEGKKWSYTQVKQGVGESYTSFLERLQKAIENSDLPEDVKPILARKS